jgi:starvation-inducible outer membrane lipoprotein
MKKITVFLLASMLVMSGCITMKDHVNYRLLDNINEELKIHRLTVKDAAQIYEAINRCGGAVELF